MIKAKLLFDVLANRGGCRDLHKTLAQALLITPGYRVIKEEVYIVGDTIA